MKNICTMQASDIDYIVDLHIRAFPHFFLTSLGKSFLRQYYISLLESCRSVALVLRDNDERIRGFVTGVINPSGFYKELLKLHWYRFFFAAAPQALRRPRIIPKLLKAYRKPEDARAGNNIAELTSICVAPEEENRGYGKKLVHAYLHEISQRGCKEVVLYTDAQENERVNAFYKALGFKISKTFVTPEGRIMHEYWRFCV